jgi:hypothetical protein
MQVVHPSIGHATGTFTDPEAWREACEPNALSEDGSAFVPDHGCDGRQRLSATLDFLHSMGIAFSAAGLSGGRGCVVVSLTSIETMTDVSPRARFNRRKRVIIPAVIALLAVGAFLQWGPIGFGNGPLVMGDSGVNTMSQPRPVSFADLTLISYPGSAPVTIDGITLVNRTSYPTPRLVSTELVLADMTQCTFGQASAAAEGFGVAGCGSSRYVAPLTGHPLPLQPANGVMSYAAGLEMSPPKSGGCWVLTDIVVHYHIGVRHYSADERSGTVVCAGKNAAALTEAASQLGD